MHSHEFYRNLTRITHLNPKCDTTHDAKATNRMSNRLN